MERDLVLDRAQAERRLANEAEAGATAGRLRAALGAGFADAWVRGVESGTLTAATTDAGDVPATEAQGAVVRHSLADLDAAKSRLDRAAQCNDTFPCPARPRALRVPLDIYSPSPISRCHESCSRGNERRADNTSAL
ncbi:hypothetical protein [Streptomyces sp. NRRL S-37]|uniref:hypothetical protein n=1 Tax=Streptomyces sp. NRRL S-37 TaxID=1463903 RepID=UPI000B1517A9